MFETVKLWLPDEQKTHSAGKSLAHSFYEAPLTIFLKGNLGAGKTTFLQGLAQEMGIVGPLTSPTYALEQHYVTNRGIPLIHIDLYRLSPADAAHILSQTDNHEGIRCVEWADRLDTLPRGIPHILIELEEKEKGRDLTVAFGDIPLPTDADITQWREDVALPQNVRDHCDAVSSVTEKLGKDLLSRGFVVRMEAVTKAAKLHDLLRFLDFGAGGSPAGRDAMDEEAKEWTLVRDKYPMMKHEEAAAAFLHDKGFDAVASIVSTHGLTHPHAPDATLEQLLLYYADKRVAHDKTVSLRERFDDFTKRYGKDPAHWQTVAENIETSLFPDGPPF